MEEFIERLKQRKLVQWAAAYVAAAFALLQGVDIVGQQFGWPETLQRGITLAMVLGFFVALVLAWYHGEKGKQSVSTAELLILAVLLAVGGGLMWRYAGRTAPDLPAGNQVANVTASQVLPDTAIPARSIAVLPFENLSSDEDNAYFSDGMQDLILTKLAEIAELKVISRTSTRKYASRPDDLKSIGQQLGVATILEGSVQKAGNQVLINVQLIDAATDAHLWADSYTRTLDDVFGVEGEVAGKIAAALKTRLSPAETQSLATALSANPAANDLYLRAEYFAIRGEVNNDLASLRQAIALYRQATAKAPEFAMAWARLSYSESRLAFFGSFLVDVQQLKTDARAHAEQALALAPDLTEAHLAMGYCDYYGRRDYAAALSTFSRVLKTHPNHAATIAATGYLLKRQGRFTESLATLQKALALDPRNSMLANEVGLGLIFNGRPTEAKAAFRHALALDPANIPARSMLSGTILFADGDTAGALAAAQGDSPELQGLRVDLLVYQRKYREALALLADIPERDHYAAGAKRLNQAEIYRLSGDMARARPLYEQVLPLLRGQLKAQSGDVEGESGFLDVIAIAELGLGRTAAGMVTIARSQALAGRSTDDVIFKPAAMLSHAQLYAQARRPDLAVPLLEQALVSPGLAPNYAPVMLWIDPLWDPIRHDAGFQALQKRYASAKPRSQSGFVQ
ncbi:MAG: tetratricopeptide repeat protein [Burkholderiales bacterium]|nr:MAG: tetratricopeptide repeat protein [Burkholderiales bacterium]